MRRLLALTLLIVIVLPTAGVAAQEESVERAALPVAELRDALRDKDDRRLADFQRTARAEMREVERTIATVERSVDDPDILLVHILVTALPLDLSEVGDALPLLPLYTAAPPRLQAALTSFAPSLAALAVAVERARLTPAEALGMAPDELREALRVGVLRTQRPSQAELAQGLLLEQRLVLDDLRLFGGLVDDEIAARATETDTGDDGSELPADPAGTDDEPGADQTGFSGVWTSTYGEQLVLTQSDTAVTGSYGEDDGRVQLEITGDRTLEGFWIESDSQKECDSPMLGSDYWGGIAIVFDEGFASYDGVWAYCDTPVPEEFYGYWKGSRVSGDSE